MNRFGDGEEVLVGPGTLSNDTPLHGYSSGADIRVPEINSQTEGSAEAGYWEDLKHDADLSQFLLSGINWMTLEEYNTTHGTEYTWE